MTDTRLVRSDLPPKQRKPIKDAVDALYKRHVLKSNDKKSKNTRRGDFAKALKDSLDESFGPHWHVLVGEKLGFACKKRNQTMAVLKVEESMVVIWQSPGIEEPEPASSSGDDTTKTAEAEGTAGDEAEERKAAEPERAIRVLEPTEPEEGSTAAEVVAALRSELAQTKATGDTQALAAALRKRLTADFGTIWHVATGSDFVLEAAANRRNHVLLSASLAANKAQTRIVCFQHEQFKGGTAVDWLKLFRTLPYLMLAVFCLGYMTLNSVCNEESPDPSQKWRHSIRTRFCDGDWEGNLQYVAAAALVCMFLGRRVGRSSSLPEDGKVKTA